MSVKKYRVFCNNESTHVIGWSETEPITCFNDNTHVIDTNQTSIVDIQSATGVRVLQTYDNTVDPDSYFLYTKEHTINPNSTVNLPIEIDIDANIFAVNIHTAHENIGDLWSSYINKDTVIGVAPTTITGTEIKMSEDTVAVIKPGYYLSYDNGTTYNKVIAKTTNAVTMKENVIVDAGNPIMMTYFLVHNKKIMTAGKDVLGSTILGSFRILKDYNVGLIYTNNSSTTKKIIIEVEITF